VHLARWLLPWIVALTVSSGMAYAMNRALLAHEFPHGDPPARVCEFGSYARWLYDRPDHCAIVNKGESSDHLSGSVPDRAETQNSAGDNP
jgi:hypothetical protein